MRSMGWVGLAALSVSVISACDDPQAMPAPKNAGTPTTGAMAPVPQTQGIPQVAGPTPFPITSTSPDAIKAYRTATDLLENGRGEEAREQLKKAISLDASFTAAIVELGALTPGAEGDAMIAGALANAKGLPEAEMVALQVRQAWHANDNAKVAALAKKLVDLLPTSARAHYAYGSSLQGVGDMTGAKTAYLQALQLEPGYGGVLNELAYLELYLGDTDSAIAHFQRYVKVRPDEPNPLDSLADAYLLAGRLDDAESSYTSAMRVDPKFIDSMTGVAFANLYRGDTAKGLDTFTRYRDSSGLLFDKKASAYYSIAWSQLALGKTADAMKTVDMWESDAKKETDIEAAFWPAATRLELMIDSGKPDEAIKGIGLLVDRITKSSAPETRKAHWALWLRTDESAADARLKKAAEADKARAAVDSLATTLGDSSAKVSSALAHGNAAVAKGDYASAAKEFAACPAGETYCAWERMKAEEKAGLKPQAAASKDGLTKERRRDGVSFFVWSKVTPMTMGRK